MNIWLVSAFEPTVLDNTRPMRFMGLAEKLLDSGHSVTWFTSTFNHSSKSHRFAFSHKHTLRGGRYILVFIRSRGYKRNVSPGRMLAHLDLANQLVKAMNTEMAQTNASKPDAIVMTFPPISTTRKVSRWGQSNKVPVILDIIDPWPDVFLSAIKAPPRIKAFLKNFLFPFYREINKTISTCSGITGISKGYVSWATSLDSQSLKNHSLPHEVFYPAVAVASVQNALNSTIIQQATQQDYLSKPILTLIYAGSLSASYDIPSILRAATILEYRYPGKVKFIIAGSGTQQSLFTGKTPLPENVVYVGWLAHERIYEVYSQADLGLAQYIKGATQTVTYKLFDYLAAGLPVLNSLDGEMREILNQFQSGAYNPAGDFMKLVENIELFMLDPLLLQTYKNNALKTAAELGDSETVYGNYVKFIEAVVCSKKSSEKTLAFT